MVSKKLLISKFILLFNIFFFVCYPSGIVSQSELDGKGGGIIAFYSEKDGNSEIYIMNADGSNQIRLTNLQGDDYYPCWSKYQTKKK